MITKINKFFELLDDLSIRYRNQFKSSSENENTFTEEIESLYLTNRDLFPFDMKSAFESLRLEYDIIKTKSFFWDKLKYSYYNYEAFIDMDHNYLIGNLYDISKANLKLFNHSKILSANYFFLLAHDYYFHFGKSENRDNITITVNLLQYYNQNKEKFNGLEYGKSLQILKDDYNNQYQKLEREIRYTYTFSDFTLDIMQPHYDEGNPLNFELENLNQEYILKLELLKDYKKNIKKFSMGLKFEFPLSVHFIDEVINISFTSPDKVFQALIPHLQDANQDTNFIEPLRKIIFAERATSESKINFKCGSATLVYFFKQLYINNVLKARIKEDISDWIILNFKFYHAAQFNDFQADSIQKTLMRECDPPLKIISYSY